jgi:hypothetical protein
LTYKTTFPSVPSRKKEVLYEYNDDLDEYNQDQGWGKRLKNQARTSKPASLPAAEQPTNPAQNSKKERRSKNAVYILCSLPFDALDNHSSTSSH